MIIKIFSILILTSLTLAQNPLLYCNLLTIEGRCTCNFVIFNPTGLNNLTIGANPAENCTLSEVVDASGSGMTLNVPSVLCDSMPKLEELRMERIGISNMTGNPFRTCYNLKRLHLSNNSITAVPAYAFTNTVLETLKLDYNDISNTNFISFDGLSNLRILDLTRNPNLQLTSDAFDHLLNLRYLHLSSCGLTSFTPRLFENLMELRDLDISRNIFTTTEPNLFSSLEKLESLDMSYCGLLGVAASAIQNNTELLKLNLGNNRISNMVPGLFASQRKLKELSLENNNNALISPEVLSPLVSIQTLKLSNCNINGTDSSWFNRMYNLAHVDLSHNRISEIPPNTFSAANNIQSLNFAINQLRIINSRSFGSMENLHSLNLASNPITQIDHHLISQSTDLLTANFMNMNCASFSTNEFKFDRNYFMQRLTGCFDTFDGVPIEIRTANSTEYDWYSIRSHDGWDALKVFVKIDENAHIALTDKFDPQVPAIEIQIGQNRNTKSYILEEGNIVFEDTTRYRLNSTDGSTFIIGWRFGIVMVFRQGDQFPFMAHTIRNSFNVNFFGLRVLFDYDHLSIAEWNVSRMQNTSP